MIFAEVTIVTIVENFFANQTPLLGGNASGGGGWVSSELLTYI